MTRKTIHIYLPELLFLFVSLCFLGIYFFLVPQRKPLFERYVLPWHKNLFAVFLKTKAHNLSKYLPKLDVYSTSLHGSIILGKYQTGISESLQCNLMYGSSGKELNVRGKKETLDEKIVYLFEFSKMSDRPLVRSEKFLPKQYSPKQVIESVRQKKPDNVVFSILLVNPVDEFFKDGDFLELLHQHGFSVSQDDYKHAFGKPAIFIFPSDDNRILESFWLASHFIMVSL
jgi:hypothetical protein